MTPETSKRARATAWPASDYCGTLQQNVIADLPFQPVVIKRTCIYAKLLLGTSILKMLVYQGRALYLPAALQNSVIELIAPPQNAAERNHDHLAKMCQLRGAREASLVTDGCR